MAVASPFGHTFRAVSLSSTHLLSINFIFIQGESSGTCTLFLALDQIRQKWNRWECLQSLDHLFIYQDSCFWALWLNIRSPAKFAPVPSDVCTSQCRKMPLFQDGWWQYLAWLASDMTQLFVPSLSSDRPYPHVKCELPCWGLDNRTVRSHALAFNHDWS